MQEWAASTASWRLIVMFANSCNARAHSSVPRLLRAEISTATSHAQTAQPRHGNAPDQSCLDYLLHRI